MTPDPREDALEKARALLQDIVDMKPPADHTGVWSRAVEALAALSTSPSQSESDNESPFPWANTKFVPGTSFVSPLTMVLSASGECIGIVHVMNAKIPEIHTDVLKALSASSNPAKLRRFMQIARNEADAARAELAAVVAASPSPTPYVRPAAEIRAEIERMQKESDGKALYRDHSKTIAALTWTLTPPTQEPNKETPDAN